MFAYGSMRKILKCNSKHYRKKEDMVDDEVGSEEGEKISVSEIPEEGEKVSDQGLLQVLIKRIWKILIG